jgi:hypothetical protein
MPTAAPVKRERTATYGRRVNASRAWIVTHRAPAIGPSGEPPRDGAWLRPLAVPSAADAADAKPPAYIGFTAPGRPERHVHHWPGVCRVLRSRRKSGKDKAGQDEGREPNGHDDHPCDDRCRQSNKMRPDVLAWGAPDLCRSRTVGKQLVIFSLEGRTESCPRESSASRERAQACDARFIE